MKVYLDNGSTTKVDEKVLKAMTPYFTEEYGNASSLHFKGQRAKMALEESREIIAKSIKAKVNEIIFTSGGSESDNLALKGVAYSSRDKGKHIITSKIEHPAVMNSCKSLIKEGFEVEFLDVDREGFISLEDLEKKIRKDTILVSIMAANNEIGTIQDYEGIGKICKEKGVLFHTDAVQAYTKVPLNIKNVDLISFSSHKIHGPKGVGALFVREGIKIKKLMDGGSQERKLRAGTENVSGAVGFARAVQLTNKRDIKNMTKLRDKLINNVLKEISDTVLNGSREKRLCNNVNFCFRFVEGEAIGAHLDGKGICSSTGSACSARDLKPSHVLLALGLKPEEVNGSLRLTLSRFTTAKEIAYVLEVLPGIIEKLRRISPLGK